MPSRSDIILEELAWNSLDRYIALHPKPRMSSRFQHRCKLWLRERISGYIGGHGPTSTDFLYPIEDDEEKTMLEYARRTLDD